mmetsp:Transcript_90077/g.226688  ORF Transcript_90077/g.226688 Transcript_90077/m.226688 type:complete len:105 (-) Transcript_90077:191-505(-)
MDSDLAFYKALGGGKEHKPCSGLMALVSIMANPFSKSRMRANLMAVKSAQNTTGEGYIAGGVYVIGPDGKATYSFSEEELGDKAPIPDVIAAVHAAAAAAKTAE